MRGRWNGWKDYTKGLSLKTNFTKEEVIACVHPGIFNPEPQPVFNEDKSLG